MSRNANDRSELATTSAGSSPATIRQKRQLSGKVLPTSEPRARAQLVVLARTRRALSRALQLGIEVVETARRYAAGFDEAVDILFFEADHAPEFVRGQCALVNESVKAAKGHSEVFSRLFG